MDNNNQNNNSKMPKNAQVIIAWVITFLIAVAGLSYLHNALSARTTEELSYDTFMNMVDEKQVEAVSVEDSRITIEPKKTWEGYMPGKTYYTVRMDNDLTLAERLRAAGVDTHRIRKDGNFIIQTIVSYLLLFGLMGILLNFMMRRVGGGGGIMGVGKSNAKVYVQKETGVTFRDVAGEDEAKESLTEIVDFLHNPGKYTKIGAKLPKGALLVGPPGTGKTLLAKAVAGEAKVPFYSLSGSDFVEMFVGVGASRVRDLFKQAQESAPCIIFIDEVDAIGKSRDSRFGGGNDEREQTLNQLLSEMDGFDSSKGLLVLAATNRPEILDPALLRPGRFDRRIIVDKPDLKGRVDILKVHSRDVLMDESVDLDAIALATSGAVGSDLANMINEAAILAVKSGRQAVAQKDLFEAVEVVLVGKEKKDRIMNKEERRIVSYHEVGHALVSALQKDAEPVQKITIVPRTMGALGYVMHVPEEEKYLNTKKELHAMLVGYLGGRAAEELVFETVTTGAANDIEQATRVARAMITQYGMSDKFGLMGLATQEDQYLTGRAVMNCGDATAAEVDTEVMKMLKEAYEEAKSLLSENRDVLDKIAEFLIEKETITGKEFMKIFREMKGIPEPEEKSDADKMDDVESHKDTFGDKNGGDAGSPGNDGGTGNSGTLENPAAGEVSAVSEEKKDAGDGFGDMFGNPDFGEVKR
ncbi:MAG: ATP-dependent zinc metalloprotease FtsH [Hungatella hathewayi]|uniref:ATP-dependent zinc metalloprotease FtsH n=1 Tax=Hungatella hathewayi TaxID=154046 RepID=UPI0039918A48